MSDTILVGLLSLAGTIAGSLMGVLASHKITMYRVEQLEKKVDKHNNLMERMALVEQSAKSAHKRLDELSKERGKE